MANENFYTIATKRGKEKIQDYYRQNKTLPLTHMGFGGIDGDEANYQRPNVAMTVVPHEWARIGLERKPDEGFIGGGATIENKVEAYKGKWICNVGIYDEDGELILISAYRPLLVDPEESIVSSYPINIQSVLANAEHVVVQTDTSITHPMHDEMNQALEELDSKLSGYATTDAAGLIELATHQEVSTGEDAKRAVTPATLKPELDEIKELINEAEGSLSQPATTERLGLTELATQQEVDQRTGGERVVTAQTLDKPGLISFLQRYADEEVKKLKELIFGGNPSAALDTLFELANAYEGAADSIQNILNSLSTKLPSSTFETFQTAYNQWKAQIQEQVSRKWEAVDASASRKGIVQLTNAVNSTSQVLAASALGLKTAYDKAASAYDLANSKWTAVNASTSVKGIVKLVDSVTSTSTSDAATPNSVKQANDLAKKALTVAEAARTQQEVYIGYDSETETQSEPPFLGAVTYIWSKTTKSSNLMATLDETKTTLLIKEEGLYEIEFVALRRRHSSGSSIHRAYIYNKENLLAYATTDSNNYSSSPATVRWVGRLVNGDELKFCAGGNTFCPGSHFTVRYLRP
ncbi:tail fiber protein [Vibrio harveyi]|nr:tail fiber protein [Vibrio harveyi]